MVVYKKADLGISLLSYILQAKAPENKRNPFAKTRNII